VGQPILAAGRLSGGLFGLSASVHAPKEPAKSRLQARLPTPQLTQDLWTTPSDLARFVLELQKGGHVLQPATQREMLTKVLGDYGLGLGLAETGGHKSFSHGGANAGFRCTLFGYLDGGSGAVVMTNGDGGSALADEILRSISAEYQWADYRTKERTVASVPPDVLQAYAGLYALAPGFDVTVTYDNGKLFATAQGKKVELFPESPTSFFSLEADVPAIRFTRASDNSVEMSAGGAAAKRQGR